MVAVLQKVVIDIMKKTNILIYNVFSFLFLLSGISIGYILRLENLNRDEIMYLFGFGLNKNGWIIVMISLISLSAVLFYLKFLKKNRLENN